LRRAILKRFEEDLMRKSILISVLLVLTIAPCLLMGCNEAAAPFTVTDDLGREVSIEKTPESVVSLAPSITEILFALGLGDKVVGVTEHCDYPEAAKGKPKVGGYFTTSLESILEQDPDLILTDGYDPVIEQIKERGIPMLVLQPTDISGILSDIKLVGDVMNVEGEALRLVDSLQQRMDDVVESTANVASRPTVFYEIDASDQTKPWTVGPGSFADTLISLAGGQNIIKEGGAYPQINLEKLLSADPDVVILGDYPYVTPEQVKGRAGVWQELPAVKDGRVYAINDPSLTSRPGPRIIDGLEELARIIHPELFPG
jgi:iron complex transport system substrate-binding protein